VKSASITLSTLHIGFKHSLKHQRVVAK